MCKREREGGCERVGVKERGRRDRCEERVSERESVHKCVCVPDRERRRVCEEKERESVCVERDGIVVN